ncbi:MAG: hypothetical protein D3904_18530 [Candidatus Electrothrix sp. EH2]|nr:hypothetical protein [Candidatus Electrothrix sp. EH2]
MLLIVMLSGTASLRGIVLSQQGLIFDWWIFKLPFLSDILWSGGLLYLLGNILGLVLGVYRSS